MLLFLTFIGFNLIFLSIQEEKCATVKANAHFSSGMPLLGFAKNEIHFNWIKFDPNSAQFLFKPDEPKGHLCMSSWNKLTGTTRCGYLNHPHQDSDRFVWRRPQKCFVFKNGFVLNSIEDCDEKDLIEIAGYAYDKGLKPFQNDGTLLKVFRTKVKVDVWYGYRITINPTNSVYELLNSNKETLETLTIEHRDCGSSYNAGTILRFYFGGQCKAPQQVSACYQNENEAPEKFV